MGRCAFVAVDQASALPAVFRFTYAPGSLHRTFEPLHHGDSDWPEEGPSAVLVEIIAVDIVFDAGTAPDQGVGDQFRALHALLFPLRPPEEWAFAKGVMELAPDTRPPLLFTTQPQRVALVHPVHCKLQEQSSDIQLGAVSATVAVRLRVVHDDFDGANAGALMALAERALRD